MSNRTKPKGGRYTPATKSLVPQSRAGEQAADLITCLDAVADIAKLRQEVEASLVAAVAASREAGAPWTALGVKRGVSRQPAQERYGRTSPPKGETVLVVRVEAG